MLEQTLKRAKAHATSMHDDTSDDSKTSTFVNAIQSKIDRLYSQSRQGLWNMAAFVLLSIFALICKDISILDYFSENFRQVLGAPPAPYLIHIVLAVSTISAVIIISGRIVNEGEPGRRWEQLCHRAVFYLFYFFSNALDRYFLIVFAAGLAVLVLEQYQIWTYFTKAIRQEQELIRKVALWPLIASEWQKQ